ncbi:MAG: LptF/LptG family permease, partial [Bdellovibrionales bacterium]|nr:LptF/LptG family permease [Bdellovibrionales bacterium]
VFLHVKDKGSAEQRIIFARSGELIKLNADELNPPSLRLHLTDGNIVKINEAGEEVEKILFQEYDFPVFSAQAAGAMLDKDSMKTNSELSKIIEVRQKDYIYNDRTPPKDEDEKNRRKEAKKSIVKSQIEYFGRFITLPQIMLFVLLGFSLGVKKGRGGNSNNSIRAILILLGYYGLYFFMLSLAQRGVILAIFASTAPLVLLLLISLYYFRKLDWVG